MYLALYEYQVSALCRQKGTRPSSNALHIPFWWIPFLFHLCEYAVGLVVDTMRTLGHLAVALDLLLPAHVASLQQRQTIR